MRTSAVTVHIEPAAKKRLDKLAKRTRRSRSLVAAEAIDAYLDVQEWQVAAIKDATRSLDRGHGLSHAEVEAWVDSWGTKRERAMPKRA